MHKFINSSLFLWLVVTCIGSAVGFTLGGNLGTGAERDYRLPLFMLIRISLVGLLIGIAQWIILRNKLAGIWGWIPATTMGLPLGFLCGFFVSDFLFSFYANEWVQTFIMSSIAGLFTGILQWLALRRNIKEAPRWLFTSALSWGISITVTGFIFDGYLSNIDLGYLFAPTLGLLIGALVGIVSGVFVRSILMQNEHNGAESFRQAS